MTFGEWLREKITEKGISNAELARRVEVTPTYIGNLVRDYSPNKTKPGTSRPSEGVVERIAIALGENVDDALKAAGYYPKNGGDEGLWSGYKDLPPEKQKLARKQIKAIIESLADDDDE